MWLPLIEIGFVGFVASLFGAVWRGFDSGGKARRPLLLWLLAAGLFFAMWLFALARFPVPYSP